MASLSSGQHEVNIDTLLAYTTKTLHELPSLSSEPCIYMVSNNMRVSNQQYFTPQIVSIGPIHYQNEKLRANEHLKKRYLKEFLQHTRVSLKECYELIIVNEKKLRNCYADVIELNSENFVKMVLADAAFLLMIFLYNADGILFSGGNLVSKTDKIFGKPEMINNIRYDLLLLENQLPFFILEELYKLSKLHNILNIDSSPPEENDYKFYLNFRDENAMTSTMGYIVFINLGIVPFRRRKPVSNAVHIPDLLRKFLIPDPALKLKSGYINIPRTKELHQAGVMIQVGSDEDMFDITFDKGTLKVPILYIQDSTELVFRNLLAFELCHCPENHIFSDYLEMMRWLTLSSEDTELLIRDGVIYNGLPSAERVTALFNNITTGNVRWSSSPYSDVAKDLNEYCEGTWHKWKAAAKQRYFKSPWAICSVSAAVFLLVLTVVQTVFTILQVVLKK